MAIWKSQFIYFFDFRVFKILINYFSLFCDYIYSQEKKKKKKKAKIIPFTYLPGLGTMSLGRPIMKGHVYIRSCQVRRFSDLLIITKGAGTGLPSVNTLFPLIWFETNCLTKSGMYLSLALDRCVRCGALFTPSSMWEVLSVNQCESVGVTPQGAGHYWNMDH
jgi:hypothetical protein